MHGKPSITSNVAKVMLPGRCSPYARLQPGWSAGAQGCSLMPANPPSQLNPAHMLAGALAGKAQQLDLAFAAFVDGQPALQLLAAAATGAVTALGLYPLSLLSQGLPHAAVDWIETFVGGWAVPLAWLAALAMGTATAAWHVRTWAAAQLALADG
jgi:hypothetical protein